MKVFIRWFISHNTQLLQESLEWPEKIQCQLLLKFLKFKIFSLTPQSTFDFKIFRYEISKLQYVWNFRSEISEIKIEISEFRILEIFDLRIWKPSQALDVKIKFSTIILKSKMCGRISNLNS